MQVVNWIKGKQCNGEMGHILEDCCSILSQINCSMMKHCRRTTILVAHEIAKTVKELGVDQIVWREISTLPLSIQTTIRSDIDKI